MSIVADSLRSATYNPEAEKAIQAEKEKADKARGEIETYLSTANAVYVSFAGKSYTPKWTLDEMDKLLKESQKWLESNPSASEQVYKNKLTTIKKRVEEIGQINQYLYVSQSFEKVMKFMLGEFEQKKLLTKADRKKYEEFYTQLKNYNSSNRNPKLSDMKIFFDRFNQEVQTFSVQKGIWDSQQVLLQTAFQNPDKFEKDFGAMEQQAEVAKAEEDKKFSFQRFTKKVTGTATTVIGSLLYVVFCLTIGMLAANQAIGREPSYRVLYFLYGAIFAPFLVFYYIYLWFNNKSPKIYTLLPLTQTQAETTIGKFLLFPFTYKEDKVARDLLVEFLTQSAEAVGKTFDPKSLGSIGQQAEKVAENLKNLAAETKEALEESLPKLNQLHVNELAGKATAEVLPKVNQLRVNA
jgi:hypothetical protein